MHNKATHIVALLSFIIFNLTAQERQITLTDGTLGSPVEDAHIHITQIKTGQTTDAVTNKAGVALISLPGRVAVEVRHLSYLSEVDTLADGESKTFALIPLSFQLGETVITGQFKPESTKNSLFNVKVITAKTIEQRAANNVKDLLAQELNVRVSQDQILGSGLSLQGLSGEQVKYMIDGVPVIGRVNGDIDISQLNLNDVERIEIIEGPVSVLYGTNALGGVVNIITKSDQSQKVQGSVSTYYESVGTYNVDAMAGFSKKGHYLGINGGRYFFDGFGEDKSVRDLPWNPKEQYFGTLKYGYKFTKGMRLLLSSNVFKEKVTNRGNQRDGAYSVWAFDDYYNTLRSTTSLTISGPFFKKHYLNQVMAYAHYQRLKNTMRKDLSSLEEVAAADPTLHDTTRFNTYMARGFISRNVQDKKYDYQLGYDINIEQGTGKKIDNGSQVIGDYALFMSAKYRPVGIFTIQPGLRWSYNSAYRAPLTPSLHVKVNPTERVIIRVSYARGFRAPSIKELYLDFYDVNHNIYGNQNLNAEHSNNVNVQLSYAQSFAKVQVLKISPSFFFNDIRNDIELVSDFSNNDGSTNQPFTYANLSSNRIMGSMLNVAYTRGEDLNISTGVSAIGRKFIFNDTVTSGSFLFSPEVSVSVSYRIPKALIRISVFNKYNASLQNPYIDENGAVGKQTIGAYNLLDITLARSFWKNRITLMMGVKNVTDVVNVETAGNAGGAHSIGASSVPVGWGRSYFASLRFNIGT